jgi:hypothetical protein
MKYKLTIPIILCCFVFLFISSSAFASAQVSGDWNVSEDWGPTIFPTPSPSPDPVIYNIKTSSFAGIMLASTLPYIAIAGIILYCLKNGQQLEGGIVIGLVATAIAINILLIVNIFGNYRIMSSF